MISPKKAFAYSPSLRLMHYQYQNVNSIQSTFNQIDDEEKTGANSIKLFTPRANLQTCPEA